MKVILIVLVLLIPGWCYADGNKLLKQCGLAVSHMDGVKTKPNLESAGEMSFCLGFMQGITNMNLLYQQVLKSDAQFCLPEHGITNGQAARIIVKYLRNYPEDLHEDEFVLAALAFKDAFPCKKGR
jgi:hypothetical protein